MPSFFKLKIPSFKSLYFLIPKKSWLITLAAGLVLLSLAIIVKKWTSLVQQGILFLADKGHVRLENLHVEGRHHTKWDVFIKALGIQKGEPLFQHTLSDIQERLQALPWVKSVTLQRKVPNTLIIRLVEQYPIAYWQYKNQLSLVDDEGHVIKDQEVENRDDLLVVTGDQAPQATPLLIAALKKYPSIKERITGAMYIGKRRWDIILDTKIRIKLPETHLEKGIDFFKTLEERYTLDPQSILYIDTRYPDKAYIRYRGPLKAPSNKPSKQA